MADQHTSVESDEQIDLDGDNDIEDMMDDEDAREEDGFRRVRNEYHEEEQLDEYSGEDNESDGEEHGGASLSDELNHASSPLKGEGTSVGTINEEESEKHAELLALPPHGSEVFVGGLPRDATDEDLRDLCEPFGEILEIRLVKDKDKKENKGFAFIVFTTRNAAEKAIEEIQDKELKGRKLRCSLSQVKHRLFIGNIPKCLAEDDLRKILEQTGPGIENIECFKDPQNPSRNRGFLFVEYYNNACADYARQKMSRSNFKIDGSTPTVRWADPKNAADASAATQVKAIFVKNLPESIDSEKLKKLFERHGDIAKVVLPPAKAGQKRDYGFIHFAERSSALNAVKGTEKYEIDGQAVEVSLAKPQTSKLESKHKYRQLSNFSSHGYPGDTYASFGGGYSSTGLGQPMIYGKGLSPAGMRMVPLVLPDGRVGYVLQQHGTQPLPHPPPHRRSDRDGRLPIHRRSDRGGGSPLHQRTNRGNGLSYSADSGRDGSRGRRYRPY